MCTMAIENDFFIVNNVGGVDKPYLCEDVVPNTSSLDMESLRLEITLSLENEVLQFSSYKSSNCILETTPLKLYLLGFFVENDDLHVDLENPQMLQCIIYKSESNFPSNFLSQSFILKKSLIEYNKINGITPMKTHVDFAHPKLFIQRKL